MPKAVRGQSKKSAMKKLNLLKRLLNEQLSFLEQVSITLKDNQVFVRYKSDYGNMLPSAVIRQVSSLCEALGATYYIDNNVQFRCYYV